MREKMKAIGRVTKEGYMVAGCNDGLVAVADHRSLKITMILEQKRTSRM